jgi:hypothetical protein
MVKKNGECLQSWPFSAIVEILILDLNDLEISEFKIFVLF